MYKVFVKTPSISREYSEVSPALTRDDLDLLRQMGAEIDKPKLIHKEDVSEETRGLVITFNEDLPTEVLFLLESRLEGKSPSEVVKALTDAKEAEEKESANDGSLPESPEGSEKGSTDDSEPVNESSAE